MLVDKKEPRDAEFDEVKAEIVDVVKLEKARAQVEEIAKQIAGSSANASALSAAAAAKGLKAVGQERILSSGHPSARVPPAAPMRSSKTLYSP